jgi:hypothetical protein
MVREANTESLPFSLLGTVLTSVPSVTLRKQGGDCGWHTRVSFGNDRWFRGWWESQGASLAPAGGGGLTTHHSLSIEELLEVFWSWGFLGKVA